MTKTFFIVQAIFNLIIVVLCVVSWLWIRRMPSRKGLSQELEADIATLQNKAFQLEKELEHYRKKVVVQLNSLAHICESAKEILNRNRKVTTWIQQVSEPIQLNHEMPSPVPTSRMVDQLADPRMMNSPLAQESSPAKRLDQKDWAIEVDNLISEQLS